MKKIACWMLGCIAFGVGCAPGTLTVIDETEPPRAEELTTPPELEVTPPRREALPPEANPDGGYICVLPVFPDAGPPGACVATLGEAARNVQLSDDALEAFVPAEVDSVNDSVRATLGHGTGRFYFEVTVLATGDSYNSIGVAPASLHLELSPGWGEGVGYDRRGTSSPTSPPTGDTATYGVGDVIGVAVNLSTNTVRFSKNGEWQAFGSRREREVKLPEATGVVQFPTLNLSQGDRYRINLGGSAFVGALPEGFLAWNQSCE